VETQRFTARSWGHRAVSPLQILGATLKSCAVRRGSATTNSERFQSLLLNPAPQVAQLAGSSRFIDIFGGVDSALSFSSTYNQCRLKSSRSRQLRLRRFRCYPGGGRITSVFPNRRLGVIVALNLRFPNVADIAGSRVALKSKRHEVQSGWHDNRSTIRGDACRHARCRSTQDQPGLGEGSGIATDARGRRVLRPWPFAGAHSCVGYFVGTSSTA
jgi:hypothetical protein